MDGNNKKVIKTTTIKKVSFANKARGKKPATPRIRKKLKKPKKKKIRLSNALKDVADDNPTPVIIKMLNAEVPGISVRDLIKLESVFKLLFKPAEPDVIKKIQVNAVAAVKYVIGPTDPPLNKLENILYSTASPRIVVSVNDMPLNALIDTGAEINLIKKNMCHQLKIPFTVNNRPRLVNVNGNKTVLVGICENVKISINSVTVMQSLLIVK